MKWLSQFAYEWFQYPDRKFDGISYHPARSAPSRRDR